jgi:hypothetical protein
MARKRSAGKTTKLKDQGSPKSVKRGKLEMEEAIDFAKVIGDDVALRIFGLIPPNHLLKCALVNKNWRRLSNDEDLWKKVCEEQWKGKVYVPAAKERNLSWKVRYLKADKDRTRVVLSTKELSSITWRFRFKRTAGAWWAAVDPYWMHGKDESKMMRRRFTADGRMIADEPDPLMDAGEAMQWRMLANGQIQVEDFPPLKIKRRPDWGFTLENQWVLFIADLPPSDHFLDALAASS